jgi:hypothetical protein
MTKMIFIPPFALLGTSSHYYRHLMLPHLVHEPRYASHFKQVKRLGQYVILDNGAAEGVSIPNEGLVDTAHDFRVDELVLPDVMHDGNATYARVLDFLSDYRNKLPVSTLLGYVLQGRTLREVIDSYYQVQANPTLMAKINVWYLPRLLVTRRHPTARIDAANYLLGDVRMQKPIHFLGASPVYIDEAIEVRDRLRGRVRSMDTSAPFVYAIAGKSLAFGGEVWRDQRKYFTTVIDNATRELALQNCEIMNGWVGATSSASQV